MVWYIDMISSETLVLYKIIYDVLLWYENQRYDESCDRKKEKKIKLVKIDGRAVCESICLYRLDNHSQVP